MLDNLLGCFLEIMLGYITKKYDLHSHSYAQPYTGSIFLRELVKIGITAHWMAMINVVNVFPCLNRDGGVVVIMMMRMM